MSNKDRKPKSLPHSKLEQNLHRIDWDFYGYTTSNHLAELHWYPATFIPQLPSVLIKALTNNGDTILDPFCGSGTALVEGLRLGRNVIGVDSNPLGYLLSDVKCRIVRANHEELLSDLDVLLKELRALPRDGKQGNLQIIEGAFSKQLHGLSRFEQYVSENPQLALWYHSDTLRDLYDLKVMIQNTENRLTRDLLTICFSSILRSISSQTKSWGHIADNVRPKILENKQALPSFTRQVSRIANSIREFAKELCVSEELISQVHNDDAKNMSVIRSNSVDLVVTSPPYPRMTDYALSQRLSCYWLGWDINYSHNREIGSRRRRFQASSDEDYLRDMGHVVQEIRRILKAGAYLCFVLPLFSEIDENRRVLISRLIASIEDEGFSPVAKLERNVPRKRRRHNWPSLDKEQIHIWRKGQ